VLLGCGAFSQPNAVETGIRDDFNRYRSSYLQEKLYVHTDKSFYVPGEILWFRIYDVDASFHRPLNISKIAYVELLDASNRSVLQEKVSLKPGEDDGSLVIPVTLPSGNYRFRAYTRWMKNFSANYFFEKSIRIANLLLPAADSVSPKEEKYDIQFFPEGGDLVQQVNSKVAFRITDEYGKGLEASGALVDDQQDTLLKFQTLKMGLGHFNFTPAANRKYNAVISLQSGRQVISALPSALSTGYALRLERNNGLLNISVHTTGIPDQSFVYLLVHTRGSLKKMATGKLAGGQAVFSVDPAILGDGISQFTLFNYNGNPVCERLYFKYPEKELQITVDAGRSEYSTRREVDLNLMSTNQNGKPEMADMSLSVYRLDSLQGPDGADIGQYLYLVSDLGAGIESPGSYFNKENSSREDEMDNLMLTHGWRRFIWNDVLEGKPANIRYSPELDGHILEGRLVNNKTSAAVPFVNAYLSVPSSRTQFRVTTSDSLGHVKFEMRDFYGSQEIILQTNPAEDSSSHFEMESPFSGKYSDSPVLRHADKWDSPAIIDRDVQAQVQRVYNGMTLQQFTMQHVDTSSFYVYPDEGYSLDDFTRFQTMEEVIREYVISTNVVKRKGKFHLYVFDNALRKFFPEEPLILLDGVPIFESDKLFRQDPLKIKRLDLIASEYFLGYQSFGGIINCKTYHGDLDGFEMDPHATVLDYPGIPAQRQFFSPRYETEQQAGSRIPDFRSLLFWTPRIKTDEEGKGKLSFYTSDLPGKYAVVVEGITPNGEPGSRVIYFTVKK
ncbi:MAG TPA: hypothetical protein VHC50_09300, partial [Puia sp.]|nr:hypothetical protein [Puia sp.]